MEQPISCDKINRGVDAVILLMPLIAIFGLAYPLAVFRSSRTIYVSKQGSDWNSGAAVSSALATIQRAADLARPGDRILIGPGCYYERLHLRQGGTTNEPVVVEAEIPGSVIITGELPDKVPSEWHWRDDGEGVFSTPTSTPVYRLNHGDATCFRLPWGGAAALKAIAQKPGAWSAFCEEDHRLYVALKNGKSPAEENLRTHRPAPAPREWGEFKSATVWVEADHIQLNGLKIEFGIGAAVNIWNAENIEIRNCVLTGSTFGVKCSGRTKAARNIKLVNCLYHNFPQYHWHKDWLSWNEVYAAYSSSTLMESANAPVTVESCLVTHAGDALRISPRMGQGGATAIIDNNYLAFCTDDAFEFDGDGSQIVVRNNLVYEGHQNLGFSPVTRGPILVENNLFAHSPDGINGSQIKLINNSPGDPIRNITVRDNVFVGDWLCWYNDAPINNVMIENNRFFVHRTAEPPWPPSGVEVSDHQVELQPVRSHPEEILANWYRSAKAPAWVKEVLQRHPGPAWFPADDHPATKDAMRWRARLQSRLQPEQSVEHN